MARVNGFEVTTLRDYITVLCYRKTITMEELCEDLDISYNLFMTKITRCIDNDFLFEIMAYLNGDILFAIDLPLTSNKKKPLQITPSPILTPEEFKHTVFESGSDQYLQFIRALNYYVRQNNIRTKILSTNDLVTIVKSFANIIAEPFEINGSVEYRLYIRYDCEPTYYMLTNSIIQGYLKEIRAILGTENSGIWRKATSVMNRLTMFAGLHELPKYNPAPSYYVLTFNGIFNRKTKEFYPEKSDEYAKLARKYHFIDNASFNYLTESRHPEIVELYKEFIEHVSGDDKKLKDKLEQQLCSVLGGYNNGGLVFITSNSKLNLHVFSRLIRTLASEYLYDFANIYENTKKNSNLAYIRYNSKLLIESIYAGPTELSSKTIEKCKQIFNGDSFITARKKGYNTYFKLRVPWIQIVQSQKDLRVLKRGTKDIKSITLKLNNQDIDLKFANKFIDTIDAYTKHALRNPFTEFSDEVATYLLNNVDYKDD